MSKLLLAFATAVLSFALTPSAAYAISGPVAPQTVTTADAPAATVAPTLTKREQRKQFRAQRKAFKKQIKAAARAADTDTLLLILIAIFIAPLAMYLYEGDTTNRFWISLLLWLLFVLPGAIYTIYVIATES